LAYLAGASTVVNEHPPSLPYFNWWGRGRVCRSLHLFLGNSLPYSTELSLWCVGVKTNCSLKGNRDICFLSAR